MDARSSGRSNLRVTPTVFLLCAGSSRRIGAIKQLLRVNGEPIIRRTIRLVREFNPEIKIHMITWHRELMFDDVEVINTISRPPQLTDTILLSMPYWKERNIFLTGDTVYGKEAMTMILSNDAGITVSCRDTCPIKPSSERFTFAFSVEDFGTVVHLLKKCSRIYKGTTQEFCCGLSKLCYAAHPENLLWLISPIVYVDGTHRYINYIRPIRDYFLYHIRQFWKPWDTVTLIPITDSITTDIDTPEDYHKVLMMGIGNE